MIREETIRSTRNASYSVRNAATDEFGEIGLLLVQVYAQLDGFPNPEEQPEYYCLLAHVGELTKNPETEILVAVSPDGNIAGAVVFIGDVKYYGAGGSVTREKDACAFRLLAVDSSYRGQGVGRLLTLECIHRGRNKGRKQVVIHSTKSMQTAWNMYKRIGFHRAADLDFSQGGLEVFGFRLVLT